ncbi:MAG: class I SAM-dependent methyltransferase [Candidatus Ranarchaeia archaeon]|jgi:tRNA wybutosine-synthesizing protein 2
MPFSSRDLERHLSKAIPPSLHKFIPTGWQQIGTVILLRLHPHLTSHKKKIGELILENIPTCKSVLNHMGPAKSEYRIPVTELLAGSQETETTFVENQCSYTIDPTKIMFSPGNKKERQRIPNLIKPTDVVLDMFAGIGQFTIPIGVHAHPSHIESIEKNPTAYKYLVKNVKQNNLTSFVTIKMGDCRDVASKNKFSVVLMGLLPMDFLEFLPTAIEAIQQKGKIICHYTTETDIATNPLEIALENFRSSSLNLNLINTTNVKKINKRIHHFVAEISCEKK